MLETPEQQRHSFELFADYHQIYLEDSQASHSIIDKGDHIDALHAWVARLLDAPAFTRHLGVMPGVLCLLTARDMTVTLEILIQRQAPGDDLADWDHVVEGSLAVPSGVLVVHGCTDYLPDAPHLALAAGLYRARVYCGGLDTLSPDGLEGGDHYCVVLWPAPEQEPTLLRAYAHPW
jgi:hypothetical protein